MNEEFVPYDEALALKELGFDKPCFTYYGGHSKKLFYMSKISEFEYDVYTNSKNNDEVSAPLYQQAFKWFRKKGYDVKVQKESKGLYFGFYWTGTAWVIVGSGSYEEGELACLKKLIEIVKKKKNVKI